HGLPARFNGARSHGPSVKHFVGWLPHRCDGGVGQSEAAVSSNGAVPISCWSACATRLTMVLIDLYPHEVSAAMEGSARFVVVLLLRHLAAAEFSENRNRLFAVIVEPINTYAVVGVGVFRDLEHIGRSVVVKFHGKRIRREDVVGDVTAPLSGDVF